MTLNDIIVSALAQLDRGHDAQNLDIWRDKLTRFADEAIIDLASVIKPRRTDTVTVSGKTLDVRTLPRQCVKVLSVKKDDVMLLFKDDSTSSEIFIPALNDTDTVNITYIYIPGTLSSATDEPEIPKWYHGLIVCYVVARERSSGEVGIQKGGNIYFQMYEAGKRNIRPHLGSIENYKLLNRW
ncbi:MAG: hypothetical protein IJO48_02730 [Clostridia bacterium]|nr:hypothetical protein [Clostridia bacterium]